MGNDLDPLDDIFADDGVKNAKPAGKFQPKAKFRPHRKQSATTSVVPSQALQIDSAPSELSETIDTAKMLEHCSNDVPNDKTNCHALIEKSVGENGDVLIGLDVLGDVLPQTTTDMERTLPPSVTSVEDPINASKEADARTEHELSAEVDNVTVSEPNVSSAGVHDGMRGGELERVETDVMDSITTTESTTKSGQSTGKFRPKPKVQMQKEKREASEYAPYSLDLQSVPPEINHAEATETASYSLGLQSVPPEVNYAEKDSSPAFQQDDVLDLSSLGFPHTLPTESASELQLNEESINLMEMSQLDPGTHLEGVPEIPAKLASRRAKSGSSKTQAGVDPSLQQQKASVSGQDKETGRSLRPRKGKTNFRELADEGSDDELATVEFSEEFPLRSAIEEENVNNDEIQLEKESQTKKVKRKKSDDGKERKSKKAKDASDKEICAKPKKFSHSTRRRRLNKLLLETPEDEIDYQKLPLRDLILLAEHNEKHKKKEEAETGAPAGAPEMNQGTGTSGLFNNENFASEQAGEYNDGQMAEAEDTTVFFNYQTYMERTPRVKWSKQDTELFYEAMRQFGTDLSMIQQLFPGRTRRQVKLKYKKEERQHPMRLREALTNRSKDHSHFEKVIEQLRQIAAEENQNADEDGSIDLNNGGVDEGTSNADDDETKEEHIEQEENDNVANEFPEVQSPVPSDDDEDDLFDFSQYKGG